MFFLNMCGFLVCIYPLFMNHTVLFTLVLRITEFYLHVMEEQNVNTIDGFCSQGVGKLVGKTCPQTKVKSLYGNM